jgi:hypothetical protein
MKENKMALIIHTTLKYDWSHGESSRGATQIPQEFHYWLVQEWGRLPGDAKNVKMIIEFEETSGQVISDES